MGPGYRPSFVSEGVNSDCPDSGPDSLFLLLCVSEKFSGLLACFVIL